MRPQPHSVARPRRTWSALGRLPNLQRLVEYSYRYVPYYRRTFDRVGIQPGDLDQRPLLHNAQTSDPDKNDHPGKLE